MLQRDNFCAWISVDERELLEHVVEQSKDQLSVTCWIASEEGKAFVINWKDTVRADNSMGRTFVDGVKCGVSKGINRKGYRKDATQERDYAQQRGAATGTGADRLLVFSKLDVTDDDMYLDAGPSDKLGEIRLEISYVRKGGRTSLHVTPFKGQSKTHEMRKLIGHHSTKLGKLVTGERKPVHRVKSFGHPKVFIFRYRPLEVLQATGIAPRERRAQHNIDHLQDHSGIVDLTMDSEDEEAFLHDNSVTIADGNTGSSHQSDEQVPVMEERFSDHKPKLKTQKEDLKDVKMNLEDRKIKQEELETKFKVPVKHEAGAVKAEQGHSIKQESETIKQESKPIVKLETTSPLKLKKEKQDVEPLKLKQEGVGSVKLEFGPVVKIEKSKKVEEDESGA